MKRIYEIAEQKGVEIAPYERRRIDAMPYPLPDKVLRKLSKEDFRKYIDACWNCASEHAGGFSGWVRGHEYLQELGFVKKERTVGPRVFVRMVYEPEQRGGDQ